MAASPDGSRGSHALGGGSASLGSVRGIASMRVARACHTATLLSDGRVLIVGGFAGSGTEGRPYASVEIFDARAERFRPAEDMATGRLGHSATTLADGRVLVAGGWVQASDTRRPAELYDPRTGRFTPTGHTVVPRAGSTATLLHDGRVLLTGGVDAAENALASAEIYDPATGRFAAIASMGVPRGEHTATLLADGRVLVAGGGSGHYPSQTIYASAELYDPAAGRFTPTGSMTAVRHKHAAVRLASGEVLVLGGSDGRDWRGQRSSAELYDPVAGIFSATGSMSAPRFKLPAAVALLPDGRVLVAGGAAFPELYDPTTRAFLRAHGSLGTPRFFAAAAALVDGRVLITGGYVESSGPLPATARSEIYEP